MNVRDESGMSELDRAAATGHARVIEELTRAGAAVDRADSEGSTPLHHGAARGSEEAIQALVHAGADVNSKSEAGCPLALAAGSGNARAIDALLEHGASWDGEANSPTLMAALSGSKEGLRKVLERFPPSPRSLLACAAHPSGTSAMVDELLKAGADPNADLGDGKTAIDAAGASGKRDVVALLLQHAAGKGGVSADDVLRQHQAPGTGNEKDGGAERDEEGSNEDREQGDKAFARGEHGEAERLYTAALDKDSDNVRALANRSALKLMQSRFEEAEEDARRATEVDEGSLPAWERRGKAAEQTGDYADAAMAFFKAMSLGSEKDEDRLSNRFERCVSLARASSAGTSAS